MALNEANRILAPDLNKTDGQNRIILFVCSLDFRSMFVQKSSEIANLRLESISIIRYKIVCDLVVISSEGSTTISFRVEKRLLFGYFVMYII